VIAAIAVMLDDVPCRDVVNEMAGHKRVHARLATRDVRP
jgi:hypothetical protein